MSVAGLAHMLVAASFAWTHPPEFLKLKDAAVQRERGPSGACAGKLEEHAAAASERPPVLINQDLHVEKHAS